MNLDAQIRTTAFEWLREQVDLHGDVLPSKLLARGFPFGGDWIPLFSPQGIFKPRQLEVRCRSARRQTALTTTNSAPTICCCTSTEERSRIIPTTSD